MNLDSVSAQKIYLGRTKKFVLVGASDYGWLSQWKWHERNGYAVRVEWLNSDHSKRLTIQMHSVIMPTSGSSVVVDHINGDTLDNRRCNLRYCTNQENVRNRRITTIYGGKETSSIYKGVSAKNGAWSAHIRVNRRLKSLGKFTDEKEAARCYDAAAAEFFGEFARLNFPEEAVCHTWQELSASGSQKCQASKWSSKYKGVSWNIKNQKWNAIYGQDGGPGYMGQFNTEEAAARCVDAAASQYSGERARLNFPLEKPMEEWRLCLEAKKTSSYRGVSFIKKKQRWKAAITIDGKQKWGGAWETEEEAAKSYDKMAAKYLGEKAKLNFPD